MKAAVRISVKDDQRTEAFWLSHCAAPLGMEGGEQWGWASSDAKAMEDRGAWGRAVPLTSNQSVRSAGVA